MRTLPLVLACLLCASELACAADLSEVIHFVRLGRNMEAAALFDESMLGGLSSSQVLALGPDLLAMCESMNMPARAAWVRSAVSEAVEKEFTAAFDLPKGPERASKLQQLVRALDAAHQDGSRAHYIRGIALLCAGMVNGAEVELAAAVEAAPQSGEYHVGRARALWAAGRRVEAYEELSTGMRLEPTEENAQLLADVLRRMKRAGKADRALSVARNWETELASDDKVVSPLRTLTAEIHLERKELAPVMDIYSNLRGKDRTWLVGAIARTARAVGGRNEHELDRTTRWLSGIGEKAAEGAATFARTAGDLYIAAGKSRQGLRAYAAAVRSGDAEAAELMERYRHQVAATTAPGDAVSLLASGLKSVPEDISGAPRFLEFQKVGEAAAERLAGLHPVENADDVTALAIARELRSPGTATSRVAFVQSYLKGDKEAALKRLDELSLSSVRDQMALGSLIPHITPKRTLEDDDWSVPLQMAEKAKEAISSEELSPAKRLTRIIQMARLDAEVLPASADPILLDLNGNGQPDLTAESASGVSFDIAGYGHPQPVQWLVPGQDGWLCEDTNGDGRINSGQELFGTAGGFADGFDKLCRRDLNHDGLLNGKELAGLLVWRDERNPGVTDPGELQSVQAAGIESIEVPAVGLTASVMIHGHRHKCWDVWPKTLNASSATSDLGDI